MVLPLVSVLVRTYNRPNLLHRALGAICGQTHSNIEIVLVNDGGCEVDEIIEAVKDLRPITYVRHDRKRGHAAAANTALKNAKGKYALFLDDDDSILPTHIEGLVEVALQNPEVGVVYSDSWMAFEERTDKIPHMTNVRKELYTWELDSAGLLLRKSIPLNSALFKLDIARETLFDEQIDAGPDWDFWIRMAQKTPFLHLRKATAEFREGSGQQHSWRDIARSAIRVLSKYPEKTVQMPITTIAYLLQERYEMVALIERMKRTSFIERIVRAKEARTSLSSISPLDTSETKVKFIEAKMENRIPRGKTVEAEVTLENSGSSILIGGCIGPSVRISYHWLDSDGRVVIWDGKRSFIPRFGLRPGEKVTMLVAVEAPDTPGRYILQLATLQEGVAWFPFDSDSVNHLEKEISII